MRLAAGEWQAAADGYQALLNDSMDDQVRAEVPVARPRRWCAWTAGARRWPPPPRPPACSAPGPHLRGSAQPLLAGLRPVPVRCRGRCAQHAAHAPGARAGGLKVEPEFEMRLLIALAAVESRVANYAESLAHLEEATHGAWPMTWTIVDGPCSSSTSPSATARRGTWKPPGPAPRAWPCCVRPDHRSSRRRSRTTWPWPTSLPATSPAPGAGR